MGILDLQLNGVRLRRSSLLNWIVQNYADGLQDDFTGLWIIDDQYQEPDIVVYYAHGKIIRHSQIEIY